MQKTQDEVSRLQQELEHQKAANALQQEEWNQKLELSASESTNSASVAVAEVTQSLKQQLEEQALTHRGVLEEQRQAQDQAKQQAEQEAQATLTAQQEEAAALRVELDSLKTELGKCRDEISSKEEQMRQNKESHETALGQLEAQWRETAAEQTSTQVCV